MPTADGADLVLVDYPSVDFPAPGPADSVFGFLLGSSTVPHLNVDHEPPQDDYRALCDRDESLSRVPTVNEVASTVCPPVTPVSIDEIDFSLSTLDNLDNQF